MAPPKKDSRRPPTVERGGTHVEDDPERAQKTSARSALPPPSERRTPASRAGPKVARGGGRTAPAEADEDAEPSDYHTGNDYQPVGGDDEGSGRLNLEGDGLDALDPELDAPPGATGTEDQPDPKDLGEGDEQADDANATHAGPPLKLEIIGGPDSGKSKKFKSVRMVIGRTPGVDLQLSDQSVSRRHVELVQGDGGVLLRDLGSGNGTKVNGEKVTEKLLEHGDEIGIGKTRLRFVDEVAAFKKAREAAEKKEADDKAAAEAAAAAPAEVEVAAVEVAEGEAGEPAERVRSLDLNPPHGVVARFKALPPRRRLMVVGGSSLVLALLVVFALTRPGPPPPEDPNKKEAAQKMQLARDAVRAERYDQAVTFIEQAEKLVPGIDTTKLAVQASNELAVVNALGEVRAAIEQKRFEDATRLLEKVPPGSVKTEDQKKKVVEELAAAKVASLKQKFEEQLVAGELDAAGQVLAELPEGARRELSGRLEDARAHLEELKRDEARQARLNAVAAANVKKVKKAEAMVLAFAVVQRKFAGQEWARAAAECDRVIEANPGDGDIQRRARALQNAIPNYGRDFEEGVKKFRAGQIVASARPLRKAWEYYQQIDLQTPMGDELKEKLALASVSAGKDALLRNDLATAALNYRDAVKLDPNEPKGRQGLDEVIGRCDEVYQKAYLIRDREPREAVKLLKVVVEVTPPGSAMHEKATNLLASMSP